MKLIIFIVIFLMLGGIAMADEWNYYATTKEAWTVPPVTKTDYYTTFKYLQTTHYRANEKEIQVRKDGKWVKVKENLCPKD